MVSCVDENVRESAGMADNGGIVGVVIRSFQANSDFRGALFEIHRDEWQTAPRPVQWDFVTRQADVLQGVHAHYKRWDYIIVLDGDATVGLKDIRRESPSFGHSMMFDMSGRAPSVVTVPLGVAHGIYAHTPLLYLYGLSVAWDGSDEDLGCRYDDPALGLAWPCASPRLLQRDLELPDYATLVQRYAAVAPAP